jgi:hypothetical protein
MTEKQAEAILREIYGFLKNELQISNDKWTNVIEPRIKKVASKIAELD